MRFVRSDLDRELKKRLFVEPIYEVVSSEDEIRLESVLEPDVTLESSRYGPTESDRDKSSFLADIFTLIEKRDRMVQFGFVPEYFSYSRLKGHIDFTDVKQIFPWSPSEEFLDCSHLWTCSIIFQNEDSLKKDHAFFWGRSMARGDYKLFKLNINVNIHEE